MKTGYTHPYPNLNKYENKPYLFDVVANHVKDRKAKYAAIQS